MGEFRPPLSRRKGAGRQSAGCCAGCGDREHRDPQGQRAPLFQPLCAAGRRCSGSAEQFRADGPVQIRLPRRRTGHQPCRAGICGFQPADPDLEERRYAAAAARTGTGAALDVRSDFVPLRRKLRQLCEGAFRRFAGQSPPRRKDQSAGRGVEAGRRSGGPSARFGARSQAEAAARLRGP